MATAGGGWGGRAVARERVVIPTNVPPSSRAEASAAGTAGVIAGSAIPTAWRMSAAVSSVGRDTRRLKKVHAAVEGTAATPTIVHTLLDNHDGPVAEMAATRDVPATKQPAPS